jgi:predicted RNA methylase
MMMMVGIFRLLFRIMAAVPMNKEELELYEKKHPDLGVFRGELLVLKRSNNWKLIDETDRYAFQTRMKCKREGSAYSPFDYSKRHRVTLKVARKKMGECTLYPVPAALAVLNLFKPKKWLDPTSGWGDRLRAALLAKIPVYVGIDSNPDLVEVYRQIIRANPSSTTVEMISSRFQDAVIKKKFDLVFTSPPFDMYEVYKGATEWKSLDHFYEEFLNPFFHFCFDHLLVGGHFVLYIEKADASRMIKDVATLLPSLKYEGVFYYEGYGSPRPYYVWKKRRAG